MKRKGNSKSENTLQKNVGFQKINTSYCSNSSNIFQLDGKKQMIFATTAQNLQNLYQINQNYSF